jgi:hypothetical protein
LPLVQKKSHGGILHSTPLKKISSSKFLGIYLLINIKKIPFANHATLNSHSELFLHTLHHTLYTASSVKVSFNPKFLTFLVSTYEVTFNNIKVLCLTHNNLYPFLKKFQLINHTPPCGVEYFPNKIHCKLYILPFLLRTLHSSKVLFSSQTLILTVIY